MSKDDQVLARVRKICLCLPDTKETLTWGEPHFRVGEKIFAGCGDEDGKLTLGFKLEMAHAAAVVRIPGFRPARYVGHKGWVSVDASTIKDWATIEEMIHESYRLIAPKKSLAKLAPTAATPQKTAKKKTTRKKAAAKKPTAATKSARKKKK